MKKTYASFAEFYPFYLSEHRHPICRLLHFVGSLSVLLGLILILIFQRWWWLFALPVLGYSFAWAGHFFFEKNRPATFSLPFYSLLGDWRMFVDILSGKIKLSKR